MRIIILLLLATSCIYGENNSFSLKAGVNYSVLKKEGTYNSYEKVDVSYKFGEVFYLSWEKNLFNISDLYINVDIGFNKKVVNREVSFKDDMPRYNSDYRYYNDYRYYWAMEIPVIIAYEFFNNLSLYGGLYISQVFYKGSKDNIKAGFSIINENDELMYDKGFLFGLEYKYQDFLFNFRYQEGINSINLGGLDSNNGDFYGKNSQFMFMIGCKFN